MTENPTRATYDGLDQAYDYFNKQLFGARLPRCLITMQRRRGSYGYFSGDCFSSRDGSEVTDEIALNPKHFQQRTIEQTLSTLVHEMVHLEQHHFGKPSRGGYHNKEWAAWIERIGLMPSTTAALGGKRTGPKVSHYIILDGPFARAFAAGSFNDLYFDRQHEDDDGRRKVKSTYTCPACGLNAWAKPGAHLRCDDCDVIMIAKGRDVATVARTQIAGPTP